ncbi:zinc-binding protein A33-like [Colossoma macropomum]|uniref:zinc-binding protein A33-like n=1 Tax=Colossoma macropomum TaxID=42526 RepID=UPI001863D433|nr:zinc-binding protein A33-like [Colossoma macropomum]
MTTVWHRGDLSCPVCYDIFRDPVVLSCSHSVCKACLQNFWAKSESQECPLCRSRSSRDDPPPNLVRKNFCESFIQRCSQHNERLTLYCLEDEQLVCVLCQASEEHKDHDCRPIRETADRFKRELETALEPLQEKLCSFTQVNETCHKTTKHIKMQAQKTEKEIRQEFETLHQFLRDEEAARLAALTEEEEQKSQMMKEKTDETSSAITLLLETINTTEENLAEEDMVFLQNVKSSMKRAECSLKIPEMDSGMLIDVAKHLGNLKFKVWEKMREIVQYTPVILDPNTAHPNLTLSDDLTSMTFIDDKKPEMQQLPDNPERFDKCMCVLGSEGFSSGSHYWDVEVGNSCLWEVGVTMESNLRKGVLFFDGVWSVESNVGFNVCSPAQPKYPFSAEGGLPRIRVHLDWDKGELSFFDLLNDMDIASILHTFTEKVYPFFWTRKSNSPVKILPVTPGAIEPKLSQL